MSQKNTIHAFAAMAVRHNGNRYEADSPIEDAADAKFLVMHGLARPAPAGAAARASQEADATPLSADQRHQAIVDAMRALDLDDAELFTADRKPQIGVLEKATQLDISVAERDALWAEVQPAPELTADERRQTIIDAMLALDTDNAKLFTADKRPQVSALEEATDLEISASERDELWGEIQAETAGDQG